MYTAVAEAKVPAVVAEVEVPATPTEVEVSTRTSYLLSAEVPTEVNSPAEVAEDEVPAPAEDETSATAALAEIQIPDLTTPSLRL